MTSSMTSTPSSSSSSSLLKPPCRSSTSRIALALASSSANADTGRDDPGRVRAVVKAEAGLLCSRAVCDAKRMLSCRREISSSMRALFCAHHRIASCTSSSLRRSMSSSCRLRSHSSLTALSVWSLATTFSAGRCPGALSARFIDRTLASSAALSAARICSAGIPCRRIWDTLRFRILNSRMRRSAGTAGFSGGRSALSPSPAPSGWGGTESPAHAIVAACSSWGSPRSLLRYLERLSCSGLARSGAVVGRGTDLAMDETRAVRCPPCAAAPAATGSAACCLSLNHA
mmetsp:Transcript_27298/g.69318  ORF Transcript_27298/g.69318 Transcript_27298/m.69318 type:complete len:287 (+) Transcript_27298:176-1036(+)